MRGFSEIPRQLTHILAGSLALLLRYLTWWQAALLAVVAVCMNLLVLPRIAPGLMRPGDRDRMLFSGLVIYPISVLALVLVFPTRPDIVAASWVILAVGDGMATLVGAHVRSAALSWNPRKSTAGLAAGAIGASLAAIGVALWTSHGMAAPPARWFLVAAPAAAAIVAGLVETVPIRLDDNISVPATAAFVLGTMSFMNADAAGAAWPSVMAALPLAAAANAVVAVLGWLASTVTVGGALTGALIGVAVWCGAGPAGWWMLLLAFGLAALTTRAGKARKSAMGIAEDRGGRRGPGNAIANTGLAAWAAMVSIGMSDRSAAHVVIVAALATAASDTVASEIGKAFGRTTWLPWKARTVPAGTPGAVSVTGTLAGLIAAALLGAIGSGLGLIPAAAIAPIAVAATLASFAEGWLAFRFEAGGWLNNDVLNLLNSAIGAGLALLWWTLR